MVYSNELLSRQNNPTYSRGQVILASIISLIVLYFLVKGAGRLFGSLRDRMASDPLIWSVITVAQIVRTFSAIDNHVPQT